MITPVIMAGGSGSRLWPLSRSLYPKQFLKLTSEHTMLQETVMRLSNLVTTPPLVICNEEHRFIVAEQFRNIKQKASIILEPVGRNTAPAVTLAAELLSQQNEVDDPVLLVLAADHVIQDVSSFVETIKAAVPLAENGKLVTFGIVPSEPHTGYGYIKRGEKADNSDGFEVNEFVEKPDLETAVKYCESGEFYWNSGMFLFKASHYLKELKKYRPEIFSVCKESLKNTTKDHDFVRLDADVFATCPDESVDYAVMENTKDAVVFPLDVGWNDIGAWSALWDVNDKDESGNTTNCDTILQDTTNSLIHGGERLITTIGLDNIVIVDTKDALLVACKDKVQDVKKIVEQLKSENRNEYKVHREVYRPWGKYDSIDNGQRYQVKRITVNPGEKLSIQMHHHRAEHWIVVSGTASVTNGDKTFLVTENESTYIPIGVIHALENPGKVPLEMIEVQSGSYLGEDDIVRFEDRYGRL
jgi:mannose-1-phosphate guanylyltransferase